MEVKKVLVVGAGTLGQQIGFQCATHGFETITYDSREDSLDACRASHRQYADLFTSQRGTSQAEVDGHLRGVVGAEDVDMTRMIATKMSMGPFGVLDMVGLETAYNIASYWGEVNGDKQFQKNAQYLKTHFLDQGN